MSQQINFNSLPLYRAGGGLSLLRVGEPEHCCLCTALSLLAGYLVCGRALCSRWRCPNCPYHVIQSSHFMLFIFCSVAGLSVEIVGVCEPSRRDREHNPHPKPRRAFEPMVFVEEGHRQESLWSFNESCEVAHGRK